MTLPKLTSTGDNEPDSGRPHGQAAVYGGATQFRSRAHKLATLIMMTTGSANAAMFPMMFIYYGGVPFLLAYLVLLATVAMPMMQLESSLAQFSGDGNCGIFSTVPLFLGTGYALTLYVILRVVADTLPLSDVLLQIAGVGGSSVPWANSCPGGWAANNRTCYAIKQGSVPCRSLRSRFVDSFRRLSLGEGVPILYGDQVALVPSKSYLEEAAGCMPDLYTPLPPYDFRRQQSLVEHTFDNIRVQPLLSMAAIWVLVFTLAHVGFIRLKNFFYVMLGLHIATAITLLLRALSLEGAARGLQAFAYADWSHLLSVEMWCQALYTCLESVGITGTVYLAVQRLNSFKNNFHEDVLCVLVADTASKGIGTLIAFLYLGYLSTSMGVDVRILIDYGSSIIVSITPQALSLAPDPEFWSQMYLLWLLSSLVPKILIVPDIIIEALSLPHPYILRHRVVLHFVICSILFIISIIGCSAPL
ncbi:sodium-dependent proline transporter [Rhipicephalus sanguineus]|uniref:sodium-dependent proline transporter n=1 Tax=Rhipicephalus sanguineus TaxID=34632 RepID=UPI0020C55852|nr:sodium-dependent proline transporter [Rhipicephalus sanguineus]